MNNRKPFFVTGMPRSRTAWLAAWLTTGPTVCFHDPPGNAFPAITTATDRTGMSGPEVCTAFADYSASYPSAPWLVVQRRDSYPAFKKVLDRYLKPEEIVLRGWWNDRLRVLEDVINGPRTLTIDFTDLDHPNIARAVWDHLLPDQPFDATRYEILNSLNIQQENWAAKAKRWSVTL